MAEGLVDAYQIGGDSVKTSLNAIVKATSGDPTALKNIDMNLFALVADGRVADAIKRVVAESNDMAD